MDPHPHSFCVGRHIACDAYHLARPGATQLCQHGWVNRVYIRYWGGYSQTPFYRWLLHHCSRVRPYPCGGTMVKAQREVRIRNLVGAGYTILTVLFWFRLPPNMRVREKVFSVLAILSSVVGGAALILLSVFDTKRYTTVHRLFLLIFMLGVWLTAIFSVVEVRCW